MTRPLIYTRREFLDANGGGRERTRCQWQRPGRVHRPAGRAFGYRRPIGLVRGRAVNGFADAPEQWADPRGPVMP